MAVRYAENLTLFKSAIGRDRDGDMKGKQTKKEAEAENQKTKCNRSLPTGRHEQPLVSVKAGFFVSYCLQRWPRGGVANVDSVIRLVSSVSVGPDAIC